MTVFYRKYRPQRFSEMVGQEHIKKILLGQLESGKISHGYLFSGPRGTGKTSTARIFAKAVNCEVYSLQFAVHRRSKTVNRQPSTVNVFGEPCNKCLSCKSITDGSNLDLIEVDAASNRGIDEIRDLREKIKLSPVSSHFKVYIIDEVHMLTNEAFNALLKTLEEPPTHAIFILCTTEPDKLPETIISRLVRMSFSRAKLADLIAYIANISKEEGIRIDRDGLTAIAKEADGSFRDCASILDQLAALGEEINVDDVRKITKASGFGQALEILGFLLRRDLKNAVEAIVRLEGSVDFGKLTVELISLLREMLMMKIGVSVGDSDSEVTSLVDQVSMGDIKSLLRYLLIAEGEMRLYPASQISLILAFCEFCPDDQLDNSAKNSSNDDGESSKRVGFKGKKVNSKEKIEEAENVPKEFVAKFAYAAGNLAEVEAVWSKFLDKVKSINAHVMAVLRNSRPVAFDGKIVVLEVFFSFHKDKLEEPKIMDILCGTISEVMGKNVAFKVVLSDGKSKVPRVVSKSDLLEVDANELTLIAQEIFTK